MGSIQLNPELRAKLNNLAESCELRDENDQVVGRFLPEREYTRLIYAFAESKCPPMSGEERERRRNEKGGRSLSAILKDLGAS